MGDIFGDAKISNPVLGCLKFLIFFFFGGWGGGGGGGGVNGKCLIRAYV